MSTDYVVCNYCTNKSEVEATSDVCPNCKVVGWLAYADEVTA